VKIFT